MPSTIVPPMPIGSLPGTSRRASAPAINPTMMSVTMSPSILRLLGGNRRPLLSGTRQGRKPNHSELGRAAHRTAADPDTTGSSRPVTGLLAVEIERPDPDAAVDRRCVKRVGGHDPGK